jgi:hypothetical protein
LLAKRPVALDGHSELLDTHGDDSPLAPRAEQSGAPAAGPDPRSEELLIALSVYREPADRNAILFQLGTHDWTAARAPDRQGPAPPYQAPPDLAELLDRCVAAGMLSVPGAGAAGSGAPGAWFVDRWIAADLHARLAASGRSGEVAAAHCRAAAYWQWRAAAWPQGRRSDIHDLLETRHHLFRAGETDSASEVTQIICAQLHAWGDLGREAEIIQSTLGWLPGRSPARAHWLHELGTIAALRGDPAEAERQFAGAADMSAALGDDSGVARAQHSLGVLAQTQGEYRKAERWYRKSAAAGQRADAAAGAATDQATAHPAQAGAAPVASTGSAGQPARAAARQSAGPRQPAAPPAAMHFSPAAGQQAQPDLPAAVVRKREKPLVAPVTSIAAATKATAHPGRPAAAEASTGPRERRRAAQPPASQAAERRDPQSAGWRGRWPLPAVAVLAVAAAAFGITGIDALTASAHGAGSGKAGPGPTADSAAVNRAAAASWVARQVGRTSVISCDAAMCAELQQRGLPAADLLVLGPAGPADPLASNVIIATEPVRTEFGAELAQVYAPLVLASFGYGQAGIEVRAIAPDGAAAYQAALRSDQGSRIRLGNELIENSRLALPPQARGQLTRGAVDDRQLAILATLADLRPLRVVSFGDAGPGAGAAAPLREVIITADTSPASAAWASPVLSFLTAQQSPYRPASAVLIRLRGGKPAVQIEYPAPGPLGLLTSAGAATKFPAPQ